MKGTKKAAWFVEWVLLLVVWEKVCVSRLTPNSKSTNQMSNASPKLDRMTSTWADGTRFRDKTKPDSIKCQRTVRRAWISLWCLEPTIICSHILFNLIVDGSSQSTSIMNYHLLFSGCAVVKELIVCWMHTATSARLRNAGPHRPNSVRTFKIMNSITISACRHRDQAYTWFMQQAANDKIRQPSNMVGGTSPTGPCVWFLFLFRRRRCRELWKLATSWSTPLIIRVHGGGDSWQTQNTR